MLSDLIFHIAARFCNCILIALIFVQAYGGEKNNSNVITSDIAPTCLASEKTEGESYRTTSTSLPNTMPPAIAGVEDQDEEPQPGQAPRLLLESLELTWSEAPPSLDEPMVGYQVHAAYKWSHYRPSAKPPKCKVQFWQAIIDESSWNWSAGDQIQTSVQYYPNPLFSSASMYGDAIPKGNECFWIIVIVRGHDDGSEQTRLLGVRIKRFAPGVPKVKPPESYRLP
ncbi:hypothetical protein Spb1_32430 [Planctopirus ephydatiae]|uniref:Uncharacterized protein n=1 Tax=Planctopirus ephydatiae TaxID=2528019 RepID=A0A518GRU7_9PLAN|nr:hypothetical protein [Planctopirus ephydatiae]QDV31299.1 hypothetical protein Spb1_32430 [Planctopirus ephydatiae]